MLSIGEFSSICKVSTKTLRYYAEIGLILPDEINPENGYRYYSIDQLEKMLLINRLKAYHFSLEEIKAVLDAEERMDEALFAALVNKKKAIEAQVQGFEEALRQIEDDISALKNDRSIMPKPMSIDVQVVDVPVMQLLSIRKNVMKQDFAEEYFICFGQLLQTLRKQKLTMAAPPMVLFHGDEYRACGLDTEFAIPVKECTASTNSFHPGLCLKTVVHGAYSQLSSVYANLIEYAKREGYENTNALYEVYVTDPSEVSQEGELITEVYYPVRKKANKHPAETSDL